MSQLWRHRRSVRRRRALCACLALSSVALLAVSLALAAAGWPPSPLDLPTVLAVASIVLGIASLQLGESASSL